MPPGRRLRILIIPGLFPFPPVNGGKICIYSFIEYLRFKHEIHLYLPLRNDSEIALVEEYRKIWPEVAFHTVQLFASARRHSALSALFAIRNQAKIFFNYLETAFSAKKVQNYDKPPGWCENIEVTVPFAPFPEQFVAKLTEILKKFAFDIVQIEYTSAINLVNVIPPGPKKIFVEIESRRSVLKDYGRINRSNQEFIDYVVKNTKDLEHAFMKNYDALFTLNDLDCKELKNAFPGINVFNSPFPVMDSQIIKNDVFDAPIKLLFLGGESHYPNYDALIWFVTEIMPLVQNNERLKLYVTGSWQKETIRYIRHLNGNVIFTGFLGDLTDVFKGSISIVPIRIGGGGLRAKIIYSMAAGSPVITTPLAIKGFNCENKKDLIVADTKEEFAGAINELLCDLHLSGKLIKNGKKLIVNQYGQGYLAEKRDSFYQIICNSLRR
ncbi:MAG: rfaG [Elusimicrobia bacterium]|nr:MAG: rfaG [Elusimicrobiota bacterium]KAF0156998.1 MAG: rfaG [Elusimicrobiota bacterium]